MTPVLLRALEHVHGHLGWMSVAALAHPAVFLRRPRRAPLSVVLATSLVIGAAVIGALIYPRYRDRLKQHIFLDAPRIGWLFERKEHLAVGAVAFALAGCVAHLALPLVPDSARRAIDRLAHRAFVAALALSLVVAALGIVVAAFRSF